MLVTDIEAKEILRSALSMWWLRPENGLAVAGYCIYGVDIIAKPGEKAADFACGDGVNTFFKCGGRFDDMFDIFGKAVDPSSQKDVVAKHIDIFDYFDPSYQPNIVKKANCTYTYGTDHKQNLLKKAEKLGFYEKYIKADMAENCEIPDGSLDLIYCNSLYWTPTPEAAFKQIMRKLKVGGRAVFDVMTAHRKKLQFAHAYPTAPEYWQDMLNRGREKNNPGLRSEREWDAVMGAAGANEITSKELIFNPAAARFWNFGMRPLAPVMNRMVGLLPKNELPSIKAEWVETWTNLLLPLLLEPDEIYKEPDLRVRLQYEIRKNREI